MRLSWQVGVAKPAQRRPEPGVWRLLPFVCCLSVSSELLHRRLVAPGPSSATPARRTGQSEFEPDSLRVYFGEGQLLLRSHGRNWKGCELVEPITGAIVAKAMGKSDPEMQKATSNLLVRVLGPTADAVGEALGRYTTYRLRNVGRIVERADEKSDSGKQGSANPRVAHILLEDGSYCDDEIMVDYLGGLLAASRTPTGRDDRAASWSNLVTSLSSLQIRAHYLLYREWAEGLHDVKDINLGVDEGRRQAEMHLELIEFVNVLVMGEEIDQSSALNHAISGLVRVGLIADHYSYGQSGKPPAPQSKFEFALSVQPSAIGVELYGWAQGVSGGLSPHEFTTRAVVI